MRTDERDSEHGIECDRPQPAEPPGAGPRGSGGGGPGAPGHGEDARLAALLESVSDAFFALDAAWRFTYVNGGAERYWGRARAELLGRGFWTAFPQAAGSENGRALERAMRERATVVWEARSPVHGTWLQARAYPAADGGLSVFFQDVEARKRAEAELATFRLLSEHANDAHYLFDEAGRIRWANRLACERMGYALAELTALTVGDLNPGVPTAAFGPYFARARRGRVAPFESVHRRKDGTTYPVEITPTVVELPDGARMLAAVRDVTERKAAEAERERLLAELAGQNVRLQAQQRALARSNQQLQAQAAELQAQAGVLQATAAELAERTAAADRARAEAEAANRAKGDFLAVMSHELRTPLNAIGGYAQLMELGLQGPVTPDQLTALGRIQRGQQHLLGLINAVLNYAKLEAGHVRYQTADVPAAELLAEAAALVAPQARAKGLALAATPCAPDLVARADAEKVGQVLLNLLSNAVKFTRGGGTVAVAAARAPDGCVALTVADTGRGIAADQLARVFEPFVQVDQRLTRAEEGTGLGLAISRDLARGMGGDLTAESTPGVGSTFTLTLPTA